MGTARFLKANMFMFTVYVRYSNGCVCGVTLIVAPPLLDFGSPLFDVFFPLTSLIIISMVNSTNSQIVSKLAPIQKPSVPPTFAENMRDLVILIVIKSIRHTTLVLCNMANIYGV